MSVTCFDDRKGLVGTQRQLGVAAIEVVPPGLRREAVVARLATPARRPRMDIHDNARTTRHSRLLMAQRLKSGWKVVAVAEAHGVTVKAVRKWRDRYVSDDTPN